MVRPASSTSSTLSSSSSEAHVAKNTECGRNPAREETPSRKAAGTDMALTILHTADWHLGRRFSWLPPEQELRLTRARLDVVARILDLAEHRNVDAVLVAGDIFDGPAPEEQWWQGLQKEFRKRQVGPASRSPARQSRSTDATFGVWCRSSLSMDLPKYVHVVDRDDFSLPIGDKAVILATPCRSHSGQSNLVSSLPQRPAGDERFRIGMIHGQTFDMAGFQTNFPIERGAAEARGLDYLALGDTHGFRDVEPDASVPTVYPGTPETMNIRRGGHRQCGARVLSSRSSQARLGSGRTRRYVEMEGHGLRVDVGIARAVKGHWAAANRPQAQGGHDRAARRVRRGRPNASTNFEARWPPILEWEC